MRSVHACVAPQRHWRRLSAAFYRVGRTGRSRWGRGARKYPVELRLQDRCPATNLPSARPGVLSLAWRQFTQGVDRSWQQECRRVLPDLATRAMRMHRRKIIKPAAEQDGPSEFSCWHPADMDSV